MVLNAFVDDSGNSPATTGPLGHFVLAGYVMRAPLWEEFSDRWSQELKREPSINCFKMYDAEHGYGDFEGMPIEFRRLKVNELSQVIFDYKPLAIATYLNWKDYKEIVEGRVPEKMDSPYAVLFFQIMRCSHEYQIYLNEETPGTGFHKVDFAFDEQGKMGLRALQWYDALGMRVPEPYKSMMGSTPIFRKDEELVALQAADMLAWHFHRNLEFPDEDRPVYRRISEYQAGRHVNREGLYGFVEMAKLVNPEDFKNKL